MSDVSRRDVLRGIALSMIAGGGFSLEAAQVVHGIAAAEKAASSYKPKALTAHEFRTLQKLADYIIPADDRSPGAVEAGAAEFIDLLAGQMERLYSANFLTAKPDQQIAMLDLIAYRKNESRPLGPGIRFFDWARRMVVDAYYTSPIGIKEVGYMGNTSVAKFEVPQDAIDYAVKRSPA